MYLVPLHSGASVQRFDGRILIENEEFVYILRDQRSVFINTLFTDVSLPLPRYLVSLTTTPQCMYALQPCTVHAMKNPTAAGVCHWDIHQSNVFFSVEAVEEVLVKEVIDFDFAFPMDQPLPKNPVQQTQNAYPKDISGNLR